MTNIFTKINKALMDINCSSAIKNIEWNNHKKNTGNIIVTFQKTGSKYQYNNVPVYEIKNMIESNSIGSYFCKHIRNKYHTNKII